MKHLLGLLAIPAILLGQVFAFSTLLELQNEVYEISGEVEELDAHQTRAAQQKRYHENRVQFYSIKVKEIEAAKEQRKQVLTLRQLELYNRQSTYTAEEREIQQEQVTESSRGEVEAHNANNVQWKKSLDDLASTTKVVACYKDGVIKDPKNDGATGCYLGGGGWHNIMLPPRSHIDVWRMYYNDHQIINRLALVNFESSFNEDASNKHAHGYVQTLRTHGVAKDISSQLEWLRNREKRYSDNGKYCGKYWNEDNGIDGYKKGEDAVLSCLYRYHNHAERTWYSKRGMIVTEYYRSILEG